MIGSFQSIFDRRKFADLAPPDRDKALMRVLEPRVLLDAAAVETALDIAGQAAHSQFADDYMAQNAGNGGNADSSSAGTDEAGAGPDTDDAVEFAPRRTDREIIFIDAAVENRDSLIASLEPGVSIHLIEQGSDGVLQMAEIIADSSGYDAIHIFSHGSSGVLQLGNAELDANSISGIHRQALQQIGGALGESGDILIYGCDFGSGSLGERTAGLLARATGADIAASDDLTGSESLAGDWDLELKVGQVHAQSFTLPDWQGILPGYELQPTAPPEVGHLDDGIVGTANTTATWSDAVSFDPGGGSPVQTYDIRATLIGLSDGMSATFETVDSGDGSMQDFRVVVTNIGPVVGNVGGQDLIEEGSVVVRWAIYEAGTNTLAPPDQMDIIFTDIEGLAGLPDSRETIGIESEEVRSFTINASSDLQVGHTWDGLTATGTEQGSNAVGSHLGVSWASSNQFVVTYTSRTLITNFDMDGDSGLDVFPTGQTTQTQTLDLNGSAPGEDHTANYYNGSKLAQDADVPVSLVDMDMTIFDFDGQFLEAVNITLTNPSDGDILNFDPGLLADLDIFAELFDTGAEQTLRLSGTALISNYETALRSISYSNINPDASFDRGTPRIVEFNFFDGILVSNTVQTTINFIEAVDNPVAGTNVYVQDEDTSIIASIATGLLSDDSDPEGQGITIIGAMDATLKPISLNMPHIMPSGAELTLSSDGSFIYVPPANYSGNETITYTISDTTHTSGGSATFDIQPVIDQIVLTVNQPNAVADEDVSSDPVDVSALSPDASETHIVLASNIPHGVVLTDGFFSFKAGDDIYETDITEWDRTQLRVLPVQNSDEDVVITFITENFEVDGSLSFDSQTVTFQFDAVADVPILIVEQAFGGIDEDVSLAEIISVKLFDIDGSEELTDITISNIPPGAQLLIESGPLTIIGGSASFSKTDIASLIFRPPPTGMDAVYNMTVSATAMEVAPENEVAQLTATRSGVGLRIELNDDDDPVVAVDDQASTFAGETVNIDVLQNDFIPDGTPLITEVNGTPISVASPVDLPGGQGRVLLSPFGYLVFEASETFAGEVKFNYTVRDADFSTDTGVVTVAVEPRWKLSSVPNVAEGDSARFIMTIEGGVAQGDVISTDLVLEEGATTAADHATLFTAISDSITDLGQNDFQFDGTTLTYNAPATNYNAVYDLASGDFVDISTTGDAVNLGNDAITERSIGFDFRFYADTFDTVFVSANGYLSFGSPGVGVENQTLDGSALSGRPIIAPFWDDLNTAAGAVYVQTIGTIEGERQLIIQWEGVENQSDGLGTGSFQVILNEAAHEIVFNYNDIIFDGVGDNGAGATIGLQSSDGVADEFAHNTGGEVIGGSSITFSRGANVDVEMYIDIPIIDDSNFEDIEDFTLRISNSVNSAIGVDNASVTIAVSDNLAPIVNDDVIATQETGTGFINVITNPGGLDFDAEGHALRIAEVDGIVITAGTAVTLSSGATVAVNLNGDLTYNPNGAFSHLSENEAGFDSFTYKVVDAFGAVSATTATVNVNITGENQTAVVDLNDDGSTSVTTNQITYGPLETTMNIAAADAAILDIDDVELSLLDITLGGFEQPGNEKIHFGGLTILYGTFVDTTVTVGDTLFRVVYDGANEIDITRSGGGEMPILDLQDLVRDIEYENDSNDDTRGTRTFSFVVTDDDGAGTPSVAQVYVVGNNVAPVAMDDGVGSPYVTVEDTPIMITVAALLANDSDIDLNPIDIVAVNGAPNGSAILDGAGNVIYTPGADFVGLTTFTYTLDDGEGGQDTGSVHVEVTPVNDAPRIDLNGLQPNADHTFVYVGNDPATSMFRASGGLIDVDDTNLSGAEVVLTNGQVDDVFNFGPLPTGIVASLVPAEAATGLTAPATVTIQFSGTASVEAYEDALRSVGFSSLSDVPSEVDRLVTVTATDGEANSVEVHTTIEIQRVNDVPDTGADGPLSFDEDSSIAITPASLLANDVDADGEALTIISIGNATNGTIETNGEGNYVFTSDPDYFGPASFTYTVEDGSGGETTQVVSLNVISVNDLTVVTLDTDSADGNYEITYIENDPGHVLVDSSVLLEDVDHLTLDSASAVLTNGQIGDILEFGTLPDGIIATVVPELALTSPGVVTITLTGTASLEDYQDALQQLTYRSISDAPSVADRIVSISVNDGIDPSNIGTTTIEVIAVNDQPIAAEDNSIAFDEDHIRVISPAELLGNDVDPDGDIISIVSVQAATNGEVELNLDGTITFRPVLNYFGPASFTYTIDDGNLEQDTATVNLTINSVNDLPEVDLNGVESGTGFTTQFVENGVPLAVVDPLITIGDVDHPQLQSATVLLTNGQIGDQLAVGTLPTDINAIVSPTGALAAPGMITITLSGGASHEDYEAALQAVTYVSLSDNPSTVDRTLSITVNDGEASSEVVISTVEVEAVNDDPDAGANGVYTFDEDTLFTIPAATLLLNDSDAENDDLTISEVKDPSNGLVSIADGVISFDPDDNYFGPASFDYVVIDGNGGSDTVTVSLMIDAVNDAPVVNLDTGDGGIGYTTDFTENGVAQTIVDSTVTITDVEGQDLQGATIVLANGRVGDSLVVSGLPSGLGVVVTPPGALTVAGSITVQLTGTADASTYQAALQSISFTSDSEDPGSADRTIFVTVTDGVANSDSAITTVRVTPVNDAPTAAADGAYLTNEDTPIVLTSAELIANDTDPENDDLTIISVQDPVNGGVSLSLLGEVTFTPDDDFNGSASFTYTIEDVEGETSTATVNVTVAAVNDLPTANLNINQSGYGHSTSYLENDVGSALVDTSIVLADVDSPGITEATFVLTNGDVGDVLEVGTLPLGISASVVPEDPLTVSGTITVTLSGSASRDDYELALQEVTFRSESDRPDPSNRIVTLVLNDGDDDSLPVTTTISITVINDAPVAGPDGVFTLDEDEVFVLPPSSLLSNDTDSDLDTLFIDSVQSAVNGEVHLDPGGSVVFTPNLSYWGPASFTYTVSDGFGGTDTALVNLNVLILNDLPIVDLDGSADGVGFVTDYAENDPGVAIVNSDISITDEDHVNLDSATVTLTNGQVGDILEFGALPGSIGISIVPPTALTEAGPITISLTGTASQIDYQDALKALTFRSVSESPDTTDRAIEFVFFDSIDTSIAVTTTVRVESINDRPEANDDGSPTPLQVTEDTPITFDPVLGNDFDVEGDTLFINEIDSIPVSPGGSVLLAMGSVDLSLDGTTLTFTPAPNYFGPASFTYQISDGNLTDVATVSLNVAAVNDAPVAADDGPIAVVEDGSVLFDPITPNDDDVENDVLFITAIDGMAIAPLGSVITADGRINLGADGRTLEFIPDAQFNGLTVVNYELSDGELTSTADVTFDVAAIDDPLAVAGTPPDVDFNDSDSVVLPMSGYFTDPDGDDLTYDATGLPVGLSIHPKTGIVSGIIDSSASQTAPYSVTITADDGNGSSVSTGFSLDVANIAPTAADDVTVAVNDGDDLEIDTAALFEDTDNDTLTFVMTGLPVWAGYDPASGLITGVAPADASASGPSTVTVTASDGDGGSAALDITINPKNVAPVATGTVADVQAQEEDLIDIDINGLFVDGGLDGDPLIIDVTGLPAGLTHDAVNGRIAGAIESGTNTNSPYLVTISADDGQGGNTSIDFDITIGSSSSSSESDRLVDFSDLIEFDDIFEEESPERDDFLGNVIDGIAGLNGTDPVDRKTSIVLSTIARIDPLHEATLSGSDDGLPEQIDAMDAMAKSTNWLTESGRQGNGDWSVAGTFGYFSLTDDVQPDQPMIRDERLDRLFVEAISRQGALYIELKNRLDAERDGYVVSAMFTNPDGGALPDWMKVIRNGFISAAPPSDATEIMLDLTVVLDTGKDLNKRVLIDVKSGAVIEVDGQQQAEEARKDPADAAGEASDGSADENRASRSDDAPQRPPIRGSIDGLNPQG